MNEELKNKFLKEIFEIADKINKTDNGIEIIMLIDDARAEYDKHFNQLLKEKKDVIFDSLKDLDGRTIPVKFKISEFEPKITLDFD